MNEIKSADEFNSLSGDYLLLASATWCGPCRFVKPILEDVSKEQGLPLHMIDVDELSDIAAEYGIKSVPSTFMFKNGQPVDLIVGAAKKEAYEAMIKKAGEPVVESE